MRVLSIICGICIILIFWKLHSIRTSQYEKDEFTCTSEVPAIQMYFYLNKYAAEYSIPLEYAYAVAYQETKYKGPLDLKYNPALTSTAGAVGPMQIIPSTANYIMEQHVDVTELRTNIELNVQISMKLLRRLYDRYHNWKLVFGLYNTGRPVINQYALNVVKFNRKHYWINNI